MSTKFVLLSTACTLSAIMTAAPSPSSAQEADSIGGLAEIVVTAQKREENLQDVPIAVTALTGQDLADQSVTRVDEIQTRVPGLFISSGNSFGVTRLNIRGVFSEPNNSGLGNSIPNYVDGIVQGPGQSLNTGLYDVAAIEVLRGPQGTLFGRNSTGGAILVRTNQPKLNEAEGYIVGEYGNYDRVRVEGAVNAPVSDKIAFRLAATGTTRNGYSFNTTINRDVNDLTSRAVRAQILFQPSETISITLRGDHARDNTNGNYKDFGPNANGGRTFAGARDFTVNLDGLVRTRRNMTSVGAEIRASLGSVDLVSLTGAGWFKYQNNEDADFTSANVLNTISTANQNQFSQELRIESDGSQAFNYVAGLYYFNEKTRAAQFASGQFATFGGAPNATTAIDIGRGQRKTESFSAFVQAQYTFADIVTLVGGLRYTSEEANVTKVQPAGRAALGIPPVNIATSAKDDEFTGTAKIIVEPSDDLMVYASFSRGFKASGFNLNPGAATDITADPEFVDSYEIGVRSEFLDRRVRLNVTGYYYDYTDLQRSNFEQVNPLPAPPTLVFTNVGKFKSKGIEAELVTKPTDELTLGGTLGISDAKFGNFTDSSGTNFNDKRPARSPKMTASIYGDLTFPVAENMDAFVRADYVYRDKTFATDSNAVARQIDAQNLFNAAFGFKANDGDWSATVFARNIFNKKYVEDVVPASGFVAGVGNSMGAPRTYGLTVRVGF